MLRNINMISTQNHSNKCYNCKQAIEVLRALDFSIQETVLYLDAYPECEQALAYYHKLMEERAEAMEAYEKQCGPLSIYGNKNRDTWEWTKGPWPWEFDAN